MNRTREFYKEKFAGETYKDGDRIPFARRIFDENELVNLVDAFVRLLTVGRDMQNDFEYNFAEFYGR